jgi:hypothetical protein
MDYFKSNFVTLIPCKEQRNLTDQVRSADYILRKVTELIPRNPEVMSDRSPFI